MCVCVIHKIWVAKQITQSITNLVFLWFFLFSDPLLQRQVSSGGRCYWVKSELRVQEAPFSHWDFWKLDFSLWWLIEGYAINTGPRISMKLICTCLEIFSGPIISSRILETALEASVQTSWRLYEPTPVVNMASWVTLLSDAWIWYYFCKIKQVEVDL